MATDDGVLIPESIVPTLQAVIDQHRQQGTRTFHSPHQGIVARPTGTHPIRAVLMQDLYENRSALALQMRRSKEGQGFVVTLLGQNFAAGSMMTIRGYRTPEGSDVEGDWFTISVPANTTASGVHRSLVAQIAGAAPTQIHVYGGNPYYSDAVIPAADTDLSVNFDDPDLPQCWPGVWIIWFTGALDQFGTIRLTVSGGSGMTSFGVSTTKDFPFEEVIVHDCFDLPQPTVLRAGTKVFCLPMPDVGYVVTASNFRDTFYAPIDTEE